MARGGKRANAGRKPGSITRKTRDIAEKALQAGLTPLDYMLAQMRDEKNAKELRMDAAKAAAPYVHARLAAIEHSGGLNLSHEDALDEFDDGAGADDPPPAEERS
jgi:hypothetical protein